MADSNYMDNFLRSVNFIDYSIFAMAERIATFVALGSIRIEKLSKLTLKRLP